MPYKDPQKRKEFAREYARKRREDPEYKLNGLIQSTEWHKNNKERAGRSMRNSHLKKAYGITLNDYEVLLENQQNLCAICSRPERINKAYLAVDHCHTTGKVRGLLCQACNTTLGKVEEREDLLLKMVDYLRTHK